MDGNGRLTAVYFRDASASRTADGAGGIPTATGEGPRLAPWTSSPGPSTGCVARSALRRSSRRRSQVDEPGVRADVGRAPNTTDLPFAAGAAVAPAARRARPTRLDLAGHRLASRWQDDARRGRVGSPSHFPRPGARRAAGATAAPAAKGRSVVFGARPTSARTPLVYLRSSAGTPTKRAPGDAACARSRRGRPGQRDDTPRRWPSEYRLRRSPARACISNTRQSTGRCRRARGPRRMAHRAA